MIPRLPIVQIEFDAFLNEDIVSICKQYELTEVKLAGLDSFLDSALGNMDGVDYYELRNLFIKGIQLGAFLAKHENMIPKI